MPFTYPHPLLAHSPSGAKNLDEWTESRYSADIPTFLGNPDGGGGVGGAQVDLPSKKQMERQVHPSLLLPDLLSPPMAVSERMQALSIRGKHSSDFGSLCYRGVFKAILKAYQNGLGDVAQWQRPCLTCVRPWVLSPTQF